MTQILQLDKWDDQELYTLFATRLPLLSLPGDFADELTQSVLDEVARHHGTEHHGAEQNGTCSSPSINELPRGRHRYPPYQ